MRKEQVQKLDHGLYKIYWKEYCGGGISLAAVGSCVNGNRWLMPTNWLDFTNDFRKTWNKVEKAKLIKST